ncbi:Modular serine protease [Eumeta japonica]|uniref:Modular serine protease n=1 Tax=Eumeta variegata TaxID=151549 RepID=A0A4C1YN93_EUMVA|nr:Modular serine protease [Eumeta japonica]
MFEKVDCHYTKLNLRHTPETQIVRLDSTVLQTTSPSCYIFKVCGIYKEKSKTNIRGGRNVKKGELTSHVGIYSKLYTPYMQICSGTIIRADLVSTESNWLWVNNLLAAHCFWKDMEGLQPASQFAVAAGKIYRPWSDSNDDVAQKSEASVIIMYRGGQTNFQDDIALLLLATPFEFSTYVWPACVDFDVDFDRRQLRDGNLGKIAGWGLTAVNGRESPILQVVELPYVDVGRCIDEVPPDFRRYVTSDKICAGYANGTALCRGDSGGGLMFSKQWQYWKRYYIRGVASTAPQNDDLCNAYAMTTFTQILAHEHFIRDYFDADPQQLTIVLDAALPVSTLTSAKRSQQPSASHNRVRSSNLH